MDRWKWQPKEEEDKKKEVGSWECGNRERERERNTAVQLLKDSKTVHSNLSSFTLKSQRREEKMDNRQLI